jgi:hypothetical protein
MSIITPESKIEELHLSKHAEKCLQDARIKFVWDILDKPGAKLRVYCDNNAFNEIKERLGESGDHIGEGL